MKVSEENPRKGQNRTSFVLTHDIFFTGFLTERPAAMHSCPQSMKSSKIEPIYWCFLTNRHLIVTYQEIFCVSSHNDNRITEI